MNGICSFTAGVLICPEDEVRAARYYYLNGGEPASPTERLHVLSTIGDWEPVELAEESALVKNCESKYWLCRAVSLLQCLLEGLEPDNERDVLLHLEEIFQGRTEADAVLARVLIAPLKEPESPRVLARKALGLALPVTANLFERVSDLQPLLRRFADAWLCLPVDAFLGLDQTRQELWMRAAHEGVLLRAIEASTAASLTSSWNQLVFGAASQGARAGIAKVGMLLSQKLFLANLSPRLTEPAAEDEQYEGADDSEDMGRDTSQRSPYQNVLKQIGGIARAVREGRDRRARRFLNELIEQQLTGSSPQYAVMSLCNIAQRCADMFRVDFERVCLDRALSIDANDPYGLIQLGDHLKRLGQHDAAIEVLRKAAEHGEDVVALSSLADVFACRGDYERATEQYKSIRDWDGNESIRTALADILRRQGRYEEAEREYVDILLEWPDCHRAVAGKAEIAKRQGRLEDAVRLYDSLLNRPKLDRASLIYRQAKCGILKQGNRLDEAHALADSIVRDAPFWTSARVLRGSILGLLGKEAKGLADIPDNLPRSFDVWMAQYFRGLLLLKLGRYRQAREQLIDRLPSALLHRDDEVVVRLGAAITYLSQHQYAEADAALSRVGQIRDYYSEYLYRVLQLHLAAARSDFGAVKSLSDELEGACRQDALIASAVAELRQGNIVAAFAHEIDLFLRVAA